MRSLSPELCLGSSRIWFDGGLRDYACHYALDRYFDILGAVRIQLVCYDHWMRDCYRVRFCDGLDDAVEVEHIVSRGSVWRGYSLYWHGACWLRSSFCGFGLDVYRDIVWVGLWKWV